MLTTSKPAHTICNDVRPLRVRDNFQGLGNRIGWWLTAAAVGEALQRPAVYTGWHGAPRWQGGRNYDYSTIRRVVQFPRILEFLEDSLNATTAEHQSGFSSRRRFDELFRSIADDEIPYHPRPYVNDYVPEPAWQMVHAWGSRGIFSPARCMNRTGFLSAYRRVQEQVRPKVDLCNPPPRSYIALHVRNADNTRPGPRSRRGAPATGSKMAFGRTNPLQDTPAYQALHLHTAEPLQDGAALIGNATLSVLQAVHRASSLPWLVLSDTAVARRATEARLAAAGLRLLERQASACDSAPKTGVLNSSAYGTWQALRDFFGLLDAAGSIAVASYGKGRAKSSAMTTHPLGESSFVTVASLAGDLPLLTPAPMASAGTMAKYQVQGNAGNPMRGIFFLDDLDVFVRALHDPLMRYGRVVSGASRKSDGRVHL